MESASLQSWIESKVLAAIVVLELAHCELAIRVVDDAAMSTLHLDHSGIEGTTDVLTFPRETDNDKVEADIAVCIDVAQRKIEACDHSVESELLLYIVHGILHCLGFDDHDEAAYNVMHSQEDRVLQAIGVGAIWSNGS